MNYKEDTIRKAIKEVLTAVIHEEFYKKVGNDYHTIPPKQCIDMLGKLEARDGRSKSDREKHKPANKMKKADQPEGSDARSESTLTFRSSIKCSLLKLL